ncbi:MAG: hypothetical protein P4L40_20745 [Terracidiphilus sp.]|nr:hypothetical protein [Terracidiphilus sp.]
MQVTITVSDAIVREAAARRLPVAELVERLIDKGFAQARENDSVASAIERIRALRSGANDAAGA